jgi:hypothetical protein
MQAGVAARARACRGGWRAAAAQPPAPTWRAPAATPRARDGPASRKMRGSPGRRGRSKPARRPCAAAPCRAASACAARDAARSGKQPQAARRSALRSCAAAAMGFEAFVPPPPVPGCRPNCLVRARAARPAAPGATHSTRLAQRPVAVARSAQRLLPLPHSARRLRSEATALRACAAWRPVQLCDVAAGAAASGGC